MRGRAGVWGRVDMPIHMPSRVTFSKLSKNGEHAGNLTQDADQAFTNTSLTMAERMYVNSTDTRVPPTSVLRVLQVI